MDPEVYISASPKSLYFRKDVTDQLSFLGVKVSELEICKEKTENGEFRYELGIKDQYSLFPKIVVHIAAFTDDQDIIDCMRIGAALAHYGVRKRIFVVPYVAYSTINTIQKHGEFVLSKITIQQLGTLGATEDGTSFLFLDLHSNCILHFFENSALRIEMQGFEILSHEIEEIIKTLDEGSYVFGTPNLRQTKWVNFYSEQFKTDIVFATEQSTKLEGGLHSSEIGGIIGDVYKKHVFIYDDIVRTGNTLFNAAAAYKAKGAEEVYAIVSHFAVNSNEPVEKLEKSVLKKIICTNSHPFTQNEIIQKSEKFKVVDVTNLIVGHLFELLPSERFPYLTI